MMSDVPWAVAWYGQRQCVWLTLNAQDDFFAINDNLKPVQALYLTPETMDGKFVSDWVRASEHSWGSFIVWELLQNQIPHGFPAPQRADRLPARTPVPHGPGTLENSAIRSTPPPAATGRQCPTTPAIPAALRRRSTPRPPRRSGAAPRKSPAQTPPRHAESRSPAQNFPPEGICVCAMTWQVGKLRVEG